MSGTVRASGVPLRDDRPGASQVPRGAWAVLFTVLGASMMDMLDATALGVAAPAVKLELGASDVQFQWISIGYLLSFSVLLLAGGRLGDIAGHRRMFLIGLAGFGVLSLACAAARSPGELIAARLLQGGAAAMMIPQCVSMIRESFGQEHSQKAFWVFSPFISLASALGPVLGGALTDHASWRWVFLVNPPACAVAFLFSLKVLPTVPRREDGPRLDVLGMVLCSLAVGLFVFPVVQGREYGWAWWTFAMMAAAAGVLALFALHARSRRRRSLDAFVETSLFRRRSFSGGTLTVFLFFGACSGAFIVNPLLLQLYLGWSPLRVGLTGSWWSLGTMSAMVVGPLLARRLRPRQVLQAGVLTQAVGMVLAALTVALNARDTTHPGPHGPLLDTGLTSLNLAPALIVSGIGTGLFFVPFLTLVLAAVEDHQLGLANGAINSLQQLGGAVATAVFSTVIFDRIGSGASPYTAGTLAYGLCAGLLVVTWVASFTLGKSTGPSTP